MDEKNLRRKESRDNKVMIISIKRNETWPCVHESIALIQAYFPKVLSNDNICDGLKYESYVPCVSCTREVCVNFFL